MSARAASLLLLAGALLLLSPAPAALAQSSPLAGDRAPDRSNDGSNDRSIVRDAAVEYLFPEQVTVPAGRPSPVQLHFRVAEGLHINSHTPRDEYLIPTTLRIPEDSGVRLAAAEYPGGSEITLPLDPGTRLSVYTGEFQIRTRIVAEPGNHLVQAILHYQACDSSRCLPPKTITVPIDVVGN